MKTFDYKSNDLKLSLFQGISSRVRTKMGNLPLNAGPTTDSPKACSALRPSGTIVKPKLSALAQLIDDIFLKKVSCYDIGDSMIVEIRHTTAPTLFCKVDANSSGCTVTTEDVDGLNPRDTNFACALFLAAGNNAEMSSSIKEYFKDYADGITNSPAIYRFCDSYYYGFLNAGNNVKVIEDKSLIEEFVTAVTDGMAKLDTLGLDGYITDTYKAGVFTKEEPKEEKSVETGKTFLDECIEGKYIVPYNWDDDQKELIPSMSELDKFYENKFFRELVEMIYYGSMETLSINAKGIPFTDTMAYAEQMFNGRLIGEPGTGKSYTIRMACAACQVPFIDVAFSKHTEEDVAEGKTRIVDGRPEFVLTDIPKYWAKGGVQVWEEPNLADPAVTFGIASQALEKPFMIMENGVNKVYRHPLTFVFACENTGLEGTNPDNPAFSNRFETTWPIEAPTEEELKGMLMKQTGQSKTLVNWVYEAYKRTINWLNDPKVGESEVCSNLSIRTCKGTIRNMKRGMSPIRAVETSIVGAVRSVDKELATNLMEEVISTLPKCTAHVKR